MTKPSNADVARILGEIGAFLDMQDVPFKPRAYEKAAEIVEGLATEVSDAYRRGGIKALEEIPGIGKGIGEKIEELLETGRIRDYEKLKRAVPVDLAELRRVEGLGPKSIKKLYQKLGVRTLVDLERAAESGKIAKLEGFGPKSEENILKGVGFVKRSTGRFILGHAMPIVRAIEERLRNIRGVERVTAAGSVRRRKETVGDVDILAVSDDAKPVMDAFTRMPEVVRVYARGETKSSVRLSAGLDADLRVVPRRSYGAALNYFTGSKDHNVALRKLAIAKGLKLNEYGLWKGKKQVAGEDERGIYRVLGLSYVEPELREMAGELEASRSGTLPDLIPYGSLRGDLQVQTDWTDGSGSIEDMARAAAKAGLEYIAITDHTKRLAMTHGLDEKRIVKQWAEIDRVNKRLHASGTKMHVLRGSECDILKDGSLDLPDGTLEKLDVVGASVHSLFNMSRKDQTERIVRAMRNPHVDILFHPTGRVIGKRDPYDVDIEALIREAKKTGTILEIDAYPDRSDLKDEHIRLAVKAGVKLSIDSDAHASPHFGFLDYGIAQARRGWAEKRDIINAWPLEKMKEFLKRGP